MWKNDKILRFNSDSFDKLVSEDFLRSAKAVLFVNFNGLSYKNYQ